MLFDIKLEKKNVIFGLMSDKASLIESKDYKIFNRNQQKVEE